MESAMTRFNRCARRSLLVSRSSSKARRRSWPCKRDDRALRAEAAVVVCFWRACLAVAMASLYHMWELGLACSPCWTIMEYFVACAEGRMSQRCRLGLWNSAVRQGGRAAQAVAYRNRYVGLRLYKLGSCCRMPPTNGARYRWPPIFLTPIAKTWYPTMYQVLDVLCSCVFLRQETSRHNRTAST
jgi:hypothetical protein